MTDDLQAIRERADAATPGPWERADGREWLDEHTIFGPSIAWAGHIAHVASVELGQNKDADAEFIAHARTDVPTLLALVGRLEQRIQELAEDVERLRQHQFGPNDVEGYGWNKALDHVLALLKVRADG